jgi:prolyl-tRNA synthetase
MSGEPQKPTSANAEPSYALPASIAPFACVVTITNVREADLLAAGEKVAAALDAAGVDTLLDDRDERAGVKFKDAELIGVPYRINIGKKLSEGLVELVDRLTHTTTDLPIDSAAEHVRSLITSKP